MQARGASTWPATPGAPTIGTATAGVAACASVTFSAPACAGFPALTGYRVISTPGCFSNTGASSPIVVSGLTVGTSYTFKAQATNTIGYGALSAASNSITAFTPTCQIFQTVGTFSWVAPAGVTSVAVVVVGAANCSGAALAYKNSIAVTPASSYTVVVSALSCSGGGGRSYFINTSTVSAGVQGWRTGDGGGNGGDACRSYGGAGGYSGNGGRGASGASGSAGSGGGGGGGGSSLSYCSREGRGGGCGVGLYGQGSSGAGGFGSSSTCTAAGGGGGGSGGAAGGNGPVTCFPGFPGGNGGNYGGGASGCGAIRGKSAVRIVWAGGSRGTPSFPSTCVGP